MVLHVAPSRFPQKIDSDSEPEPAPKGNLAKKRPEMEPEEPVVKKPKSSCGEAGDSMDGMLVIAVAFGGALAAGVLTKYITS